MQRIYIQNLQKDLEILSLDNPFLLNQLLKVLRSKIGDKVIFFDWNDEFDYEYEIFQIEKRKIIFKNIWKIKKDNDINLKINLFQSIPNKIEKIEYILQKCTEIWFSNFYFFSSKRSFDLNISDSKIERFNKIIIESVEQSWRNVIPKLYFLNKIDFQKLDKDFNLFFHTENNKSKLLKNLDIDYSKNINIFVWPEWWFDSNEVEKFLAEWFENIYLWKRILRTETAGVVVWFFIVQNN